MNYEETLAYISSVNWKGSVPGLERITELMHKLGDPQNRLKFIHIGGTNGKGSTAAFLSHILQAAGYKTGLFISPYIEAFNERMQINNCSISNEELSEVTTYIRPFADSMEDKPTEFELNTAIALEYFSRNQCDIVVFEVGMGGEFDATNVISSPLVAVITAIGLDHTAYLGKTVDEIAATKAGIIKTGCHVVLYDQKYALANAAGESDVRKVTEIISERCRCVGAFLHISEPDRMTLLHRDIHGQTFRTEYGDVTIMLAAAYQKYNLATALKTVEVLNSIGYPVSPEAVKAGLKNAAWPGRFEMLQDHPVFLVDGAHNPQGIAAAAESLDAVFPGKKLIMIFGVLADKQYQVMLDTILPLAKQMLCVSPDNSRALPAKQLAEIVKGRDVRAAAYSSVEAAVRYALETADRDDVICALGSLYMVGDIKKAYYNWKQHHGIIIGMENDMKICDNTCGAFVQVLSSKEPVPGGGGAAALCGAIGTALGNMVGSLTAGKKKYADVEAEILRMKSECDALQEELLDLADADAACFKPLAQAYALPSETEEEKHHKELVLEQRSKEACTVPLNIMQACCRAIELAGRFAQIGSKLAVSDAGCAAAILRGALYAASLNIYINTKGLADREFAEEMNAKADQMLEEYGRRADFVFNQIKEQLQKSR